MTYDLIVYTTRNKIPAVSLVAVEVCTQSPDLILPEWWDVRTHEGFLPIGDVGFEVWISDIAAEQIEQYKRTLAEEGEIEDFYLSILLACDTRITFCCNGEGDVIAAKVIAGAIAKLTGGFACDPQSDITVEANYLPAASTRFSRPADLLEISSGKASDSN